ncbi:5-hydroxytryptamine receptor 3A-like [Nothobranchius furzeri]|uniref:5-hydroxytryptamine receptor 3A-like n=1 Tax=Nothobranchius furzeri TaxID=105023 RepID=A0A9D2XM40_NOTFU|nr:5-hydroxytryptamine receptor 3A-like [Nothobranchius furzeri]
MPSPVPDSAAASSPVGCYSSSLSASAGAIAAPPMGRATTPSPVPDGAAASPPVGCHSSSASTGITPAPSMSLTRRRRRKSRQLQPVREVPVQPVREAPPAAAMPPVESSPWPAETSSPRPAETSSPLLCVDGDSPEGECSYQEVLKYLNLTKSNELFYMTRPVRDFRKPTEVSLEVLLYAILDVREIDQTFIPYVWIILEWQNDYISWNPSDFCGIQNVTIPTDSLWKPDLTIEEMTEKDKAPPSPHLIINSSGKVIIQNDQVLVSTCRMQIHKFPFDIQTCNLSIKSVVHSVEEIKLFHRLNSSVITNSSRQLMRTQYEWLFVNMTVTSKTVFPFGVEQDVIIYTISMKRRPTLYIVNFLLPILFFLFLDMSSFLISDRGGEKLSFKVTVLLAVTVMQLILNDILPSSSEWIPLIMVYCIGIFSLMMLSLLETILMMYLMERESASQDDELERNQGGGEGGEENQGRKGSLHSCEEGWTYAMKESLLVYVSLKRM